MDSPTTSPHKALWYLPWEILKFGLVEQGPTAYSTKEKHCGVTNSTAACIYDMQRHKLALVLAPRLSVRQDGRELACVFPKPS